MMRMDHDLAFMLQFENVAWYENREVKILDRRVYPRVIRYEVCKTHKEVAQAIADMVTQSAGPFTAAGMGMALAAKEVEHEPEGIQLEQLKKAGETLANARPTTANRMRLVVEGCIEAAKEGLRYGGAPDEMIFNHTLESLNRRYSKMEEAAEYLVDLFPEKGRIMTHCFGETIVGMMLRVAKGRKLDLEFYCPETRPYLQGARLTASVIQDQGYPVTVISDNMVAVTMKEKKIDVFTSAADSIVLDGHVVNKVGTMQMALVAKHFAIPYYVTGIPDQGKTSIKDLVIEERNPKEVLEFQGIKTTLEGVKGYYPAFDITPPEYVSGVVTNRGVYTPYNIKDYFKGGEERYY